MVSQYGFFMIMRHLTETLRWVDAIPLLINGEATEFITQTDVIKHSYAPIVFLF